jgi:ribosomal protein S18 acetylase RimI-like enzyme
MAAGLLLRRERGMGGIRTIRIVHAASEEQIQTARSLFVEYASSLHFDLCCFQNFDQEIDGLPGEYAPPAGFLMLATCDGETAGCVALRRLTVDTCEMKRLYVCPAFRGRGMGRKLAEAVIRRGVAADYQRMRLDTVESMKEALSLYNSLGFREIGPYRYNPVAGARYMELDLSEDCNS